MARAAKKQASPRPALSKEELIRRGYSEPDLVQDKSGRWLYRKWLGRIQFRQPSDFKKKGVRAVLRAASRGQAQTGPKDPNYYWQRLRGAEAGDTVSARELLEECRRALRKRKLPDDAVRKYLLDALNKILNDYTDATTALLLREPKRRPPRENPERDIALAIAVQQLLDTDKKLTPAAACRRIADFGFRPQSPKWSLATVERAWRTHRDALRLLTPGEITVLSDRDENG